MGLHCFMIPVLSPKFQGNYRNFENIQGKYRNFENVPIKVITKDSNIKTKQTSILSIVWFKVEY